MLHHSFVGIIGLQRLEYSIVFTILRSNYECLNLFFQQDIPKGILHLSEEEGRHAIKVLRLREGDVMDITDGKGTFYKARITNADKECRFSIIETDTQPARNYNIHIAIAPTKNADRIEWFVEKAVEIGVDQLSFFVSRNSERKTLNLDRIEKIAISAMKQSNQAWMPVLNELTDLKKIVALPAQQKFIAYVDSQNPVHLKNIATPGGHYLVLIGPEGDFRTEELDMALQNGFTKVSLGANRLRTETAGLAACHILNLANS